MSDLIKRQDVYDLLPPQRTDMDSDALYMAVYDLPSVHEWIPVTERPPEENVRVLVTRKSNIFMRDDYIDIGRYTKQKRWETEEYVNVDVRAWMPLPEPFRGGVE